MRISAAVVSGLSRRMKFVGETRNPIKVSVFCSNSLILYHIQIPDLQSNSQNRKLVQELDMSGAFDNPCSSLQVSVTGSILEYWPAAGGLDSGELSSGPAAGGLDSGVLARSRLAQFRRAVKCGPPQAGSISESYQVGPLQAGSVFTNSLKEMGFIIVLKYPLTSTYSDL